MTYKDKIEIAQLTVRLIGAEDQAEKLLLGVEANLLTLEEQVINSVNDEEKLKVIRSTLEMIGRNYLIEIVKRS